MARISVGDSVYYHPIVDEPERKGPFKVRAIGDIPSQKNVAWLEGKAGCICLEALELCTEAQG